MRKKLAAYIPTFGRCQAFLFISMALLPLTAIAAPGDTDGFDPNPNSTVFCAMVQPDGRIVLGGSFSSVGPGSGVPRIGIARFESDGTVQTNFNANVSVFSGPVYCTALQADGKILMGGRFTNINGMVRNRIARLNADGTLDTGFNPGASGQVSVLAIQADGKILMGGTFTNVAGTARNYLARLNADGTLDLGYNPDVNHPTVAPSVSSIALQTDGKALIGGAFLHVSGVERRSIAKINADGTLDAGFNPGVFGPLDCLALQGDGRILIGGGFYQVAGVWRTNLARLHTNGALDTNFSASVIGGRIYCMAVQADGKTIVGGDFTNVTSSARRAIARVNADGTPDNSFDATMDVPLAEVTLQADGKVIVSGLFFEVNGQPRRYAARLANDAATQSLTVPSTNRVQWLRGGASPESQQVTFELSTNLGATYLSLGNGVRISNGWERTGLSLPSNGAIRARARTTSASSSLIETTTYFGNPVLNLSAAETYLEDTPLNLTDILIVQANSNIVTATLTLSTNAAGRLTTATSGTVTSTYNTTTGVWRAVGPITNVNTLLAGVAFNPATNFNAAFTIETSVMGSGPALTGSKAMTGTPINDVPTIAVIGNPAPINEDAGLQTVNFNGVSAGGGEVQTLIITATSGNTNLIPNPTVTYTSPNTNGSLSYTPVTNASGSAVITVTLNDGAGSNNIVTRTFTVTVNPVNDAPTLAPISGPVIIFEDSGLRTVNLAGISAGGAEVQTLTITATSGNTNVVPNPAVTYTSPNTNGSISFTPVTNASGSAVITVTVNDGSSSNNIMTQQFTVFVDAVSDTPTATNMSAPETYVEDTPLNLINIVVNDVDSGVNISLTLFPASAGSLSTATSGSVTSTFNPANGIWSASGPVTNINALLAGVIFTPATNYNSTFTINTSAASDNGGAPVLGSKSMTGIPVNDPPTLAAITNPPAINEDAGVQVGNLAGISAGGGETQTLTVTATSGNTNLIPNPTVTYTSPNTNGSLSYTPVPNASGSAVITVTVNDGGTSNNVTTRTFTVTVNSVNDRPTLANAIPDQGATQGVPFTYTFPTNTFADVDAGNVFTYSAVGGPAWLTFTPATRTFSGTPADTNVGFVDITVTATDSGVPAFSTNDTFRLTVTNVNDVPVFTKGSDKSHPFSTTNAQTFAGWATGIGDGDTTVTQALSFNITNSNPGMFATLPSVAADGTLTYRPNGSSGTATIGVSLTDDATAGGPALTTLVQTFTIAVEASAAPPVIDQRSLTRLGDGSFQFSFANTNDTTFTVLAATNLSLPSSNWIVLGVSTNIGGGRHVFTDSQATNSPMRFYHLRSP